MSYEMDCQVCNLKSIRWLSRMISSPPALFFLGSSFLTLRSSLSISSLVALYLTLWRHVKSVCAFRALLFTISTAAELLLWCSTLCHLSPELSHIVYSTNVHAIFCCSWKNHSTSSHLFFSVIDFLLNRHIQQTTLLNTAVNTILFIFSHDIRENKRFKSLHVRQLYDLIFDFWVIY